MSTKQKNYSKIIIILVSAVLVFLFLLLRPKSTLSPEPNKNSNQSLPADTSVQGAATGSLKIFSAEGFHELYATTAYPNVQEVLTPPYITGNANADERIRQIAKERGYKLSNVPVTPIAKLDERYLDDDDLLQQLATKSWAELEVAAAKEQIPLSLVSGYRSIEYQRELFLGRLRSQNISVADIAAGRADTAVIKVMEIAAPPGYSRHHTGYTIDLACGSIGLYEFIKTKCFKWLSADNYKNAKLYGWIPSYPEGAGAQGPEAEPWEYVWVGQAVLRD